MKIIDLQVEITRFISEELLTERSAIPLAPGDDLLSEDLLDSMGVMRLVGFIEERLDLAVPPEDVTIENFLSIGDICRYLEVRLQKSG